MICVCDGLVYSSLTINATDFKHSDMYKTVSRAHHMQILHSLRIWYAPLPVITSNLKDLISVHHALFHCVLVYVLVLLYLWIECALSVYLASHIYWHVYDLNQKKKNNTNRKISNKLVSARMTFNSTGRRYFSVLCTSHLYSFRKIITFDMFYVHTIRKAKSQTE